MTECDICIYLPTTLIYHINYIFEVFFVTLYALPHYGETMSAGQSFGHQQKSCRVATIEIYDLHSLRS